jgi:hypothetical protein
MQVPSIQKHSFINKNADMPAEAHPHQDAKKRRNDYFPTLALSKSGYGSGQYSPLSACFAQAPHFCTVLQ